MRTQTISITLAFVALLFTSFASQAYNMPKPSKVDDVISKNVNIQAFSTLIAEHTGDANVQIIDVRTLAEFNAGHIEDAYLIDFYAKDFVQKLQQLDKDKTYLLYCRSSSRSGKTLKLMNSLGFKSTYNMQGGMIAWTKAKYPVTVPK